MIRRNPFMLLTVVYLLTASLLSATTGTPPPRLAAQTITLKNGRSWSLSLVQGFSITIAAQGMSRVRFMALSPDNRLFVTDMYNRADNKKGVVYILDDFDAVTGGFQKSSVWLRNLRNPNNLAFLTDASGTHWLYLALTDKLVRYRYSPGEMSPSGEPQLLMTFPDYGLNYKYGGWHLTRTVTPGGNNKIYVAVGSSCNACEEKEDVRAAVIEMNPDGSGQRLFARGLRNAVGLKWTNGALYATNMGADHLGDRQPNDTMYALTENTHYGWPWCYVASGRNQTDTTMAGAKNQIACRQVPRAFAAFRAHSSPLGFEYFEATAAPELRDSFLVALHGSGFRRLQRGYSVARINRRGMITDFILGFLQKGRVMGRPVDLLKWRDGFLLTDDYAGVVYYVFPKNEK